ncbi:hypothetical protein BC833DRAFT_581901 [Globomyces pollinis-pini]|nr:hypothetical protein BC833DRAFT_581901 [Globomyces pollinis-pini]KAJ2993444.1 hypothetical protein HDV02_002423 [Globomyces sp. JEL0801]
MGNTASKGAKTVTRILPKQSSGTLPGTVRSLETENEILMKPKAEDEMVLKNFEKLNTLIVDTQHKYQDSNPMLDILNRRQTIHNQQQVHANLSLKAKKDAQNGLPLSLSISELENFFRKSREDPKNSISKLVGTLGLSHFQDSEQSLKDLKLYINLPEVTDGEAYWVENLMDHRDYIRNKLHQ